MRFVFGLVVLALSFATATTNADISDLAVNELLVDPNGTFNFDTDGDGTAETTDEFIELINTSGSSLDISGWEIWVGSGGDLSERHEFASGTVLAAGGLIVGVNQWDPGTPPAGFVTLDAGGGGVFGNGGDNFVLYDPTANEYVSYVYNGDDDLIGSGLPMGAVQVGATIDLGSDTDGLSIQAIPDGSTTFSVAAPTPGQLNVTPVPEPTAFAVLGVMACGLAVRRRK